MNAESLFQIQSQIQNSFAEIHLKVNQIRDELLQTAEGRSDRLLDDLDRAKEESDLNHQLQIHRRYLKLRSELQNTLTRIRAGQFGVCSFCDCEIDSKRLLAIPTARFCFTCQSSIEKVTQASA